MAEQRVLSDPPPAALMVGVAVILAFAVWLGHRLERAYRRWWKANRPFAGTYASVDRAGQNYRDKRANLTEAVQIIAEIFAEVAQAVEQEPPKQGDR